MNLRWMTYLLLVGLTASAAGCGDDDGATNPVTGSGGAGAAGGEGQGGDGGHGGTGGVGGAPGDGGTGGHAGSRGDGGAAGHDGAGGEGGAAGHGGSEGVGGTGGHGGSSGDGGAAGHGGSGGDAGAGGHGGSAGVGGAAGHGGTSGDGGADGSGDVGSAGGVGGSEGVGGSGAGGAGGSGAGGAGGSGAGGADEAGGSDGAGGGGSSNVGGTGAGGAGAAGGGGGTGGEGGDVGSTDRPDGAACTDDAMCAGGFCSRELVDGWPGGYCISSCGHTGGVCPGDGVCITTGGNGQLCYGGCATSSDCRPGYACVPTADGTQRSCRPACTEDAQCPARGRCNVTTGRCRFFETSCVDGVDDDRDASVDCRDDDCAETCGAIAEGACTAAPPALPEVTGDTSLGTSAFEGDCTGAGREAVYTFAPPEGQSGTLSVVLESESDQGLYARGECVVSGSEIACAEGGGQAAGPIEIALDAGESVSLVVDATSPGDEGPFTLRSTFTQAACGDGVLVRPEQCNDVAGPGGCAADCAVVCEGARELALGANTGDTLTGTRVFAGSCENTANTYEHLYRFTPPADGTLTLVMSSATDQLLILRSSCMDGSADSEIACVDRAGAGRNETFTTDVTGGVPLFIVVDGYWSPEDAGPYTLNASFEPSGT